MDQKLYELLMSVDDADEVESPQGFDYIEALNKVISIKPEVEKLFEFGFDYDQLGQIQDATFFTALRLSDETREMKGWERSLGVDFYFNIMFSNFGNLVTIWTNQNDLISYPKDELIQLLENHGYIFVETDELKEKYNGKNIKMFGHYTWWERFFCYY